MLTACCWITLLCLEHTPLMRTSALCSLHPAVQKELKRKYIPKLLLLSHMMGLVHIFWTYHVWALFHGPCEKSRNIFIQNIPQTMKKYLISSMVSMSTQPNWFSFLVYCHCQFDVHCFPCTAIANHVLPSFQENCGQTFRPSGSTQGPLRP